MGDLGLGQYKTIKDFVQSKLRSFDENGHTMKTLFSLMFGEKENVMYERSSGYRIEAFSYGEVEDRILRRARTLSKLLGDIERGSVIGLSMDNSLDWIECFWSIILCGYSPLLINLRLSREMVERAIADCSAKAVISDQRIYSVKTLMQDAIGYADERFSLDTFGTEILVMSSGTSRHVKLCAYSAEELYHQIKGSYGIVTECDLIKRHYKDRLKLLTFLPFYHVFGLLAVYIWFSFFSRTFVELRDMAPDTITGTVRRHEVTHIFAVPLFWEKVYEQAMRTIRDRGEETVKKFEKGMRISRKLGDSALADAFSKLAFKEVREGMFGESVVFMITGGSCISPQVLEFFNAIGYRLADGYGMSEIGITSLELSRKRSLLNSGSVGLPMMGIEYEINSDGELRVRGKAMAKYIIEDGEKRGNSDWFNTHDLASFDGKCYRILGRQDDLIVAANGENLNPNLIETRITPDGVRGVALVGVTENGKTVPTLLVSVNKYITAARLGGIETQIKEQLAQLKLSGQIGRIFFTEDSLLKDNEFKLNRTRLAKELSEGNLTEVVSDMALVGREDDEISRKITAMFSLALSKPEDEIGYDADFFVDLGGSSLDYFSLVAGLRDEFGVSFTSGDMSRSTVRALHDYIQEKM